MEKKARPSVREAEKMDIPAVKTETGDKDKPKMKEKPANAGMEKIPPKLSGTDSLVVTKSYEHHLE